MRKALALLEKEAKEGGGGGVGASNKNVISSSMRPQSKDSHHKGGDLSMEMSKTSGGSYKRNPSAVMNSDIMYKTYQPDDDEVSGGKSTAMSNTSNPRVGSGKNRLGSGKVGAEDPQIYELSLGPKKTNKPTKLKPLHKSSNLAISLLEEDKSKPSYLEGVPTSAELDADIKSYLDTN